MSMSHQHCLQSMGSSCLYSFPCIANYVKQHNLNAWSNPPLIFLSPSPAHPLARHNSRNHNSPRIPLFERSHSVPVTANGDGDVPVNSCHQHCPQYMQHCNHGRTPRSHTSTCDEVLSRIRRRSPLSSTSRSSQLRRDVNSSRILWYAPSPCYQ